MTATFLASDRTAAGKVWAGATVDIKALFETVAGVATDPTTTAITILDPDGSKTTYTSGTDSEVTNPSTGRYTARIATDKPGRWYYRWLTTGTGLTTAFEGSFDVQASSFVDDTFDIKDYE